MLPKSECSAHASVDAATRGIMANLPNTFLSAILSTVSSAIVLLTTAEALTKVEMLLTAAEALTKVEVGLTTADRTQGHANDLHRGRMSAIASSRRRKQSEYFQEVITCCPARNQLKEHSL